MKRKPLGKVLSAGAVCLALVVIVLASVLLASAQPPGKLPRIGWLSPDREFPGPAALEALREMGWVDGKNVIIEYRYAEGQPGRLPELAADLVRLKVDVIVTFSAGVAVAKQATGTIPIVMATSADPVRSGFAASLARPGGNITGVTYLTDELAAKRLELLKETIPGLSRAAILWEPAHVDSEFKGMQSAAPVLRVRLQSLEVPRPARPREVERAIQAALAGRAQALILAPGGFTIRNGRRIIAIAAEKRLPVISAWGMFADAGALLTYGPNPSEVSRRTAVYVDKILKGAKPADLPVEQPTRFELVVNLKTAKALGLTFPREILVRVDRMIE